MNTGIQDAHNLAWRLAWAVKVQQPLQEQQQQSSSTTNTVSSSNAAPQASGDHRSAADVTFHHRGVANVYDHERRPVAHADAALSVRNYQRLLQITKSLFLDEQHPKMLVQLLDQLPWSPLSTRQGIFQTLFSIALRPLAFLEHASQHPWGRTMREHVRRILARGGGLPLLFPPFELEFGYDHLAYPQNYSPHPKATSRQDYLNDRDVGTADTMCAAPRIRVGYRFPHVLVKVVDGPIQEMKNLQFLDQIEWNLIMPTASEWMDSRYLTTTDLSAQVARSGPCFCLAVVTPGGSTKSYDPEVFQTLQAMTQQLSKEVDINVEIVEIRSSPRDGAGSPKGADDSSALQTGFSSRLIVEEAWSQLGDMLPFQVAHDGADQWTLCLIRPDGHVASVVAIDVSQDRSNSMIDIVSKVQTNLRSALWQSLIGGVPTK
jgi:hypothetical protein